MNRKRLLDLSCPFLTTELNSPDGCKTDVFKKATTSRHEAQLQNNHRFLKTILEIKFSRQYNKDEF